MTVGTARATAALESGRKKVPRNNYVYAVGIISAIGEDGVGGCSGNDAQILLAVGTGPALARLGLTLNTGG